MIPDAGRLAGSDRILADVTIIGSGPAGLSDAAHRSDPDLKICGPASSGCVMRHE